MEENPFSTKTKPVRTFKYAPWKRDVCARMIQDHKAYGPFRGDELPKEVFVRHAGFFRLGGPTEIPCYIQKVRKKIMNYVSFIFIS